MSARILDGAALARTIHSEIAADVAALVAATGRAPGLAVVQVGDDPASSVYVRNKVRACAKVGIRSSALHLPESTGAAELGAAVRRLNADPDVHGILVQLPLPRPLDPDRVLADLRPDKDVDGFHPLNLGRLLAGRANFVPCTPLGCLTLLQRAGIATDGAHVVVVGRSLLVGRPLAALLAAKRPGPNATVTLCHTGTRDLGAHCRQADILVVAAGAPRTVTADMVKPGATVLDVGINRVGQTPAGRDILVGDVDYEPVCAVAGAISPVPGGIGPLTIAMLLANTVRAFRRQAEGPPRSREEDPHA